MFKYIKFLPPIHRFVILANSTMLLLLVGIYYWQSVWGIFYPTVRTGNWFTQYSLNITNSKTIMGNPWSNLFDLGIVDINNDKVFDIFTSNHGDPQVLLLGEAGGQFTDALSQLRLAQNPDFPGFVVRRTKSPSDRDPEGLYIYRSGAKLILEVNRAQETALIAGSIELPYPKEIDRQDLFDTHLKEQRSPFGATQTTIEFQAQGNGLLVLRPSESGEINTPVLFRLNQSLPLEQIYIGAKRVNPDSHSFTLLLRDRHGMSWADYNGDGLVDLFIARGGLKGELKSYPGIVNDELLLNNGRDFEAGATSAGIVKEGCPGRQVASVDYDGDGLLDIYVVCGRGLPPSQFYPNQLYRQEASGKFVNVAAQVGLDFPEVGAFVWLDADNDGDMDLFWATQEKKFWLYTNQSGQFEPQLISQNSEGKTPKLTVSDYDGDGDLDIFAASSDLSILFINAGGTYQATDPQLVGLPNVGFTANWVDYDNDGLTDIHIVPGGLYRQRPNHKFEATHLLENQSPLSKVFNAKCNWFDFNNDGTRDLLIWTEQNPPLATRMLNFLNDIFQRKVNSKIEPLVRLYRNDFPNHWLEVKLIGMPTNHQAIGAKVTITTSDGKQLQQVGSAEGSHFSQGHYRLYFGLGKHQKVDSVRVLWSNGNLQEIQNVPSDQLLVIRQKIIA